MRKALCYVLLVPALLLAAGNLRSETVVAPPVGPSGAQVVIAGGSPSEPKAFGIGTADTIGGSIYDWMVNGPTYRFCVTSPGYGVHTVWMYSNDTVGSQADRNMRYNYYDFASHAWNWIDPDYMLSGVNVFTERSGFGNLDADPTTGAAVVDCHQGTAPIHPNVGRDIAAGAGIFEYCNGTPALDGYLWPPIAVGQDRTIHMFCVDDASRDNLWYSRATTWCNWDPPVQVTPTAPTFPTHQVAASKNSQKVALTWVKADAFPYVGYYRLSNDGGTNWDNEVEFPYPPAFGGTGDTLVSYYITSLNPFYDRQDRLHIVVDAMPIINDTVFAAPIEIWDWCADNTPQWNRVHRADADAHYSQSTGTNSLFADRPQLGEDNDGNLFCVWEQFDSMNVEPQTNLMRADVWIAGSPDNGITWTPAQMVTDQGTGSYRCPSISNMAIDGGADPDTVVILYQIDQVAGFRAGSSPVGPWSWNYMCAHKVPVNLIGIEEPKAGPTPARFDLAASPNPFGNRTRISYVLPRAGDVSVVVYDAAGRPVSTVASGYREAGRYSATWDATGAAAGVYFYTLTSGKTSVTKKLTLAH